MPINIDADIANADWTKKTWDLPTNELDFRIWFSKSGMTVEQFRALPVYKDNKDKYPFLKRLGIVPIPDFKPGLLSRLMSEQPFHGKPQEK